MVNAIYFFVGMVSTYFQKEVYCYAFRRTFHCFHSRSSKSVDCERVLFVRSDHNCLHYKASVKRPRFFAW
jgi:hypothetical protein